MDECEEIAESLLDDARLKTAATFDAVVAIVKEYLPGESPVVIDNTAEHLFNKVKGN
jgi:hypothetical protein